ncbi:SH3 domain-containing protein [Streptomyces sp. NRRL B-1347]|uniref:SH3 domain-containing protein n=1 Tax=Streptomyces sp. NRRL B-1347 TaxID=1476877 RepID=UPI000ABBA2E4|nr:SH3 domain-containing protein [Streptomyces sp. NRRL B-1347]
MNESGINVREFPSTDSSVVARLPYRSTVGLRCKVRAQVVDGNDVWYLLRDRAGWVAARYVDNTGNVRLCKDVAAGGEGAAAEGDTAG